MRFSDNKSTLAYHLSARPLTRQLAFGSTQLAHFSACAKAYVDKGVKNNVTPEHEALWFYLGNHALSVIRANRKMQEPLPTQELAIVQEHFRRGNDIFLRLFYYVLVICVRETRHLHNKEEMKPLLDAAGVGSAYKVVKSVPDGATEAMNWIVAGASPGVTVYECAKAMSICFHKGQWSGGFGGKKWGVIADSLVDVCSGTISPEIFCDIAFALAHNGGPIFNKGMFYGHYSAELQVILDVQRGGQIPRYILTEQGKNINMQMRNAASKMAFLGDAFVGSVDWEEVQKQGALGNYQSKFVSKAEKAKKEAQHKLAKHIKGQVSYWPGKTVTVIDRAGLKINLTGVM